VDRDDIRKLTPEEKEAFHRAAEERLQPIRYTPPPASGKPKDVLMLARASHLRALVQIVREGGENNLHYHTNSDTTWLVLKGRARFYGVGDALIGEYGPHEGILIPGGARYWFEKCGDETLELLQVVGVEPNGGKSERVNLDRHKAWMDDNSRLTTYE
jgi:mannose-6-phosphate isomerase-like protein (cupin superfamily)